MIAEYLTESPYRFSIAFGRGEFADFWGASAENERILAERRTWLAAEEERYLAALPESGPLLEEGREIGIGAGALPGGGGVAAAPVSMARELGRNWEPDYLVLKREPGMVRLVAGCVCFPSSWSLEEKIGRRIEEIHGVVPGLNERIGMQIGTFLERIKPGVSWTRNNWGLSRSPEWNQHPARKTPRLDGTVRLGEVCFRVEEQSLVALPKSNGVLFGIRLKVIPLAGFAGSPEGKSLGDLLETMPEEMAAYKGFDKARARIAALLKQS